MGDLAAGPRLAVGRDENGDANGKWVFVVEVEVGKRVTELGCREPTPSIKAGGREREKGPGFLWLGLSAALSCAVLCC